MTTAVDTNVIVALWDRDPAISAGAQSALDAALARGSLVICAPVFAELMAAPGRTEGFLDSFFRATGIRIDWALDENIWRSAGRAFEAYSARRRKQAGGPRRRGPQQTRFWFAGVGILADFLIGAHALEGGYHLLTLDDHLYRATFPDLTLVPL